MGGTLCDIKIETEKPQVFAKIYRNIHICISKFIYIQAYVYMYVYNAQISDLKKRNKTVSLISTNNKIINLYSVYIFFYPLHFPDSHAAIQTDRKINC